MANTQQLSVYNSFAFGELEPQDVMTIRETIGKDCNESQFKLFMAIAKSANANPILGEIHPSTFGGKLTVQFGIDFYVRKAKEFSDYGGYDVQLIHDNDTFKMHQERAEDGRYFMVIDEHSFSMPRGKVIGGYAFAYRIGFKPFSVIMDIDEVEHYKRSQIGMQKTMWTNNFNDMFKKHIVKRALKAAFGLNFENEEREMPSANIENVQAYERRDITEEVNAHSDAQQASQESVGHAGNTNTLQKDETPTQEEQDVETLKAKIESCLHKLGKVTKEDVTEYINNNVPDLKGKLTKQQMIGLIKVMEMQIEAQEFPEELPLD